MNRQEIKEFVLWLLCVAVFVLIAFAAKAALAGTDSCAKEYRTCMDSKFIQPYAVNFKTCKKNLEKCVGGKK